MPGTYVKDAGVWKEIDLSHVPKANNGGTWVDVKEIHVKNAGAWIRVWPPIAPSTPTNIRFNSYAWANNRYEVQVVWDPVSSSQIDGYQLLVTRVGGTNPVSNAVVDLGMTNYYTDIYLGTTGGIAAYYNVRSYKAGYYSAWSEQIGIATPGDAGFCISTFCSHAGPPYGYGSIMSQFQHDGNPENKYYDLYRKQDGYYDWTFQRRIGISGSVDNIVDTVGADHYRGPDANTTNTLNAWANNIHWTVHVVNSWGKPNNQAGSPYSSPWSTFPNGTVWKLTPPGDRVLRLNAVGTNVYRRQPTNSVGWVGGVPRCGGLGGDMEGCWIWDKAWLMDLGFANRIRAGGTIQFGLGRRNDGGPTTTNFNVGFVQLYWGQGSDPRGLTDVWVARSWQRLQGENFDMPANYAQAFVAGGNSWGTICVVSSNTTAGYAEFGYAAEIMGGWVNGQLTMSNPYG